MGENNYYKFAPNSGCMSEDSAEKETQCRDDTEESGQADIEALQLGIEEARISLQHQTQFVNEIYKDSIRAFQIYFTLVGLLIAVHRLTASGGNVPELTGVPMLIALATFTVSVILGLLIYDEISIIIGISPNSIEIITEKNLSHREALLESIHNYKGWLDINQKTEKLLRYMNLTLLILLITSFIFLAYGLFGATLT